MYVMSPYYDGSKHSNYIMQSVNQAADYEIYKPSDVSFLFSVHVTVVVLL